MIDNLSPLFVTKETYCSLCDVNRRAGSGVSLDDSTTSTARNWLIRLEL